MKKPHSVDHYIQQQPASWQPQLEAIRALMLALGLREGIKWNFPVFMLKGKNVAAIHVAKKFAGVWFFQGALLSDQDGLLRNAQEGKTQAMRQLTFASPEAVDLNSIEEFLHQAIENERQGLRVEIPRTTNITVSVPAELSTAFAEQKQLKTAFDALSPARRRDYCNYLNEAKRQLTKQRRLKEIIPMILDGRPLSDKWS